MFNLQPTQPFGWSYAGLRFISDSNLTVEGLIAIRVKSKNGKGSLRGITRHIKGRIPDPNIYEIVPQTYVGHPATINIAKYRLLDGTY